MLIQDTALRAMHVNTVQARDSFSSLSSLERSSLSLALFSFPSPSACLSPSPSACLSPSPLHSSSRSLSLPPPSIFPQISPFPSFSLSCLGHPPPDPPPQPSRKLTNWATMASALSGARYSAFRRALATIIVFPTDALLTHTRPLAPTAISYARYFPEVRTSVKRDQKRPTITIHVQK